MRRPETIRAACSCGAVAFQAHARPILAAVCYCTDCQEAGRRIEQLPGAVPVREPDGGTPFVTIDKRHWRCAAGAEYLEPHKLSKKAPTTRHVATCCNAGMYCSFDAGFWVSVFRERIEAPRPMLEWRHQIKHRHSDLPFADDLPRYRGFGPRLTFRLARRMLTRLIRA